MGDNKLRDKDREKEEKKPPMTAGQGFVKLIGPVGSAIFLLAFVLFLIYCFTGGGIG